MPRRARDDARVDLVERRLEGRHHRSRGATRSSRLTRVRRRPLTARFHVERALSAPPSRPPTKGRRGASRASPKRRGTRPRRGPRGRVLRLFVRSTRRARARVPRRRLRDGGYYDGGYYDGGPRAPSSSDDYERQAPPGGPPPDVTLLTQREIQSLLPIGATGEQYAYFWGGPETAVQRLGLSLVGLVATVNLTALLAVPTATFFLW